MSYVKYRSVLLFLPALLAAFNASASVVMTGSRVIYPSDAKSVDVQLKNNDEFPYVIQAWFDNGDQDSTPTTGKAPFVATPTTFRIAAKDGQVLRIFAIDKKGLPQDRESVFYFNFLQIPPSNIGGDKGNQMVIMLKNRLKVFYRPENLKANNKKVFDCLSFSNVTKNNIRISNASPFYISLAKVVVKGVAAKDKPQMIAPFAAADVVLNAGKVTDKNVQGIEISLINDYGAMVTHEYPIQ